METELKRIVGKFVIANESGDMEQADRLASEIIEVKMKNRYDAELDKVKSEI